MIITTWKTFLLYGLDLFSSEELAATTFFICTNEIRYDATSYGPDSQIVPCKVLWPQDLDESLSNPDSYREALLNATQSPMASFGKMLQMNMCLPCIMFVPRVKQNEVIVHIIQDILSEEYGIGSYFLDGAIYHKDPYERPSDSEKIRRKFKEHIKLSRKNIAATRQVSGRMYRETRMNYLNDMSEADQRKYLKKHYNVDTDNMDGTQIYSLMVDLFVDESNGASTDNVKDTLRRKYKESKKKKKNN